MTEWPRAMPALITPFDAAGHLDPDAHRYNVATMVDRGARGLLVGGSTGEGPYLDPGERRTLVGIAKDTAPDMTVLCGINAESLRRARAQIEEAADGGADAALVISPTTLVRSRFDLVEGFYADLAAAAPIPMFVYNVPAVSGSEIPTESVERLATIPGIVGMKDSGGDAGRLIPLASTIAAGFIVYAGASRALAASAGAGAWGAITASANYALADVSLAAAGDSTSQQRLVALTSVIERFGVPGTKAAAALTGLRPGEPRRPLVMPDQPSLDEIAETLAVHGLLAVP
jgi:dihydrodipicolinate synthase/N-acetylneuraminate lyase